MHPRPARLERLPQQYFVSLLARVAAAAAEGRPAAGRPRSRQPRDRPAAARRRGAPQRRARARRPRLRADPRARSHEGGDRASLPRGLWGRARSGDRDRAHPGHEDRNRRARTRALRRRRHVAAARSVLPRLRVRPGARRCQHRDRSAAIRARLGARPGRRRPAAAALYLNYPSNPCAVCAPDGVFADAVEWARRTGGAVVHDAAYVDIVFDGRRPKSFLATPGAKDVGVEMWSMSKTYGMAGWRVGFVVGNAEIVERINLLQRPQPRRRLRAAAGGGGRRARRAAGLRRRARRGVRAPARPRSRPRFPSRPVCEGTFYVWVRLPEGLTAERLLDGGARRGRAGRGLRPERRRLGSALARGQTTSRSSAAPSDSRARSRRSRA